MIIFKRILLLSTIGLITFLFTHNVKAQNTWSIYETYNVTSDTIEVYATPNEHSKVIFKLYKGMPVNPTETLIKEGQKWFKISDKSQWIVAVSPGGIAHLALNANPNEYQIQDYYGILDEPHRYAVKMTKMEGAKGIIETYEKINEEYKLKNTYEVSYPKEGPKSLYGDLKTVGGPVVRYLYRTTNSGMNGWDKSGKHFGVYKVSYPMPHDGLPYLINGRMSTYQYNKLPTLNYYESAKGRTYYPHPHSMLGADILIHTARKGSLGCINIENELMSDFYHNDIVTENDHEIIPFIIYDEGVKAPKIGQLF